MIVSKKSYIIQVLAIIGLALTVKLALIYHAANFDKYALSSFCSINDFIDCDGVAKTNSAQFIGIPLAWWGIFFYITILFLNFLEVFKAPNTYITVLGTIAFIVSMGLAVTSLVVIKKICILCVITYFIDFTIALIASDFKIENIKKSFKNSFVDFIDGAKKYTKTFIILLISAICFLTYTGVTLKFVPHIKQRNEILKYRKMKTNPYKINGNNLGSNNADVIIELYSDYVCPLCYINNIILHKAAKDFTNIKVIHHNYPFDKECNPHLTINVHPHACFMSRGAIAARNQNNYWGMSSLLYEEQPKDMKKMLEIAQKANLNIEIFKKDFESESTTKEINEELAKAIELDIDATPTMFINGEQIVGVKPYFQLKDILIKHGARHK